MKIIFTNILILICWQSQNRLKFLKQVYLNENVYKLKDINLIVEWCGLEEENKIILKDKTFKKELEKRMETVDYQDMIEYNCSGLDEKELHDYKVKANDFKVLCDNIKNGLKEILSTFDGEEKKQDEPQDFWAYLCAQTFNN